MNPVLVTRREGAVLILSNNNTAARNALSPEYYQAVTDGLRQAAADPTVASVILTGEGGHFCAGGDLRQLAKRRELPIAQRNERLEELNCFIRAVRDCPKPVIAAVEGYALAGGFEVVLACDLVVASSAAKFGLPEVKRGLAAAGGGLLRLPKRMPYHIAMECILTGDMLSAERAHQNGLINRLVEPGTALDAAIELANAVAANGPLSLVASKQVVTESVDWSREEMFDRQAAITNPVFASQDAREGAAAFAEKRKPAWKGV